MENDPDRASMWIIWSIRVIIIASLVSPQLAASVPLNIVVVADSFSREFLPVVYAALNDSADIPEVEVAHIKPIFLYDGLTEQDVCRQLLDPEYPPSLVLDLTFQRENDNNVSSKIKNFTRSFKIATISATYTNGAEIREWVNLNETERQLLVHIPPPGEIIPYVVRDMIRTQSLTAAGVFHDSTFLMKYQYDTLLKALPTRHIIRPLGMNKYSLANATADASRDNLPNMFILGSLRTLRKAIAMAERKDMDDIEWAWFLITKEIGPFSFQANEISAMMIRPRVINNDNNILQALKKIAPTEAEIDIAFYYDIAKLALHGIANLVKEGSWPNSFRYPECDSPLNETELAAEQAAIRFSYSLSRLDYDGIFGRFVIWDNGENFQEISMDMLHLQWVDNWMKPPIEVGIWNYDQPNGVILYKAAQSTNNYTAGQVFRVTTIIQPPFVSKRVHPNGTIEFYGYCIDLIRDIKVAVEEDNVKENFKFEYTISEAPDGLFGSMNEKMEWNGMMRELVDDRADIALAPLSVMAERETVVDFTVPYYDLVGITILMKKPKVESSLFKFLTVLENSVWGCILGAYFFTSFLLYLFDRLSPYSYHNNKERLKDETETREFDVKESLWFCMTSLTPQGGGEAPRNLSGRLVAATWWLFGFIIIASYTANLAAFLTVSRLDSPIESLDDLAKQYKIKYAPVAGTSSMTYFERMAYIEERFYQIWKELSLSDKLNDTERAKLAVWDYPVSDKYTKIWWSMRAAQMPTTFEEGVKRVQASPSLQEGFALLADATEVKYAVMTNCDLQSVGNEFSRKPLALAVRQNSTLKDKLSSAILKLLNQRKLETLKEKWWTRNPERRDCGDDDRQNDGISIENIGGVFIVIFIGVILACITLAIEYCYYKRKRNTTRVVAVREYGSPLPPDAGFHPSPPVVSRYGLPPPPPKYSN